MLDKNNPFLIAEIGINHGGSLSQAKKLIDKAKLAGADAVKFQTYKSERRVSKKSPIFNILKKCELSYDDFYKLKKYSDKKNIIFFSTPFDIDAVKFLKKIQVKFFKIASFDISNYKLIKEILKTKIPTIISTGMASLKEIETINRMYSLKKIPLHIMHCVSTYPNIEKNSFLNNINFLSKHLDKQIGLSDHTNNINTCRYAYFMGSRVFEKHFKLSNKHKCIDAPVSITPDQFQKLKQDLNHYQKVLGKVKFGVRKSEMGTKIFKRKTK